ncbi:hypothetical protein TSUD_331740 [Trifolium subterraneum]|uniref:Uncharacterized protein n=1 Tax=Trifolium subterraneum TaxID=3900 RepID=A0A2Z6MZG0_TRISU|nr:hypothetical protein TSUD_331740 [Trifolium subterraneum]
MMAFEEGEIQKWWMRLETINWRGTCTRGVGAPAPASSISYWFSWMPLYIYNLVYRHLQHPLVQFVIH